MEIPDSDPVFAGLNANELAGSRQLALWVLTSPELVHPTGAANIVAAAYALVAKAAVTPLPIIPTSLEITPSDAVLAADWDSHTVTLSLKDKSGAGVSGKQIALQVWGAEGDLTTLLPPTDSEGKTEYSYARSQAGDDSIHAHLVFDVWRAARYGADGCQKSILLANCEGEIEASAKVFWVAKPDDFVVAFQVTDKAGNPVGGANCYAYLPGSDPNKPWHVTSTSAFAKLWGKHDANAIFRNVSVLENGVASFEIQPPAGMSVVGSGKFTLDVKKGGVYEPNANVFVLEGTPTPEQPVDNSKLPPNALVFNSGSPTHGREDWSNAVDGVLEGWDGTATAIGEMGKPVFAIFNFANSELHKFDSVYLQTDNGSDDDAFAERQAKDIQILISSTGTAEQDFVSVLRVTKKLEPSGRNYQLNGSVTAKYVKIVMNAPIWVTYRQLVEFGVSSRSVASPAVEKAQEIAAQPGEYGLNQNYPNPFNPQTTISYNLSADVHVTLRVYDLQGHAVATLVDGQQGAGTHQVVWNARDVASGIYFYRIEAGSYMQVRKMNFVK